MDITLDKNSATEALIKIKLNESDYQSKFDEKIKEYTKSASIKGFRPGKVPASLIKRMYGKSILAEEINKLLSDSLLDYIKSNDLKIIGDPLPNEDQPSIDWDNQKEFEFEFEVGLTDEFEFDPAVDVTQYEIIVSEKEIDEAFEDLRHQYGEQTNPETIEKGDVVKGNLKQESNEINQSAAVVTENLSKKGLAVFNGAKTKETVSFDIQDLFNDGAQLASFLNTDAEKAKEANGTFEFEIEEVSRTVAAEVNQEFFDKIFGKDVVKSEEEFKAKYKEIMEENLSKESAQLLANDLRKNLVEKTKMELPKDFYRRWLLQSNEITAEDLDKQFDFYIEDLKWTLIKSRVADEHKIEITYQDVLNKTKQSFLEQFGMGDNVSEEMDSSLASFADNYLKQENGKNYYPVYSNLRNDRIIELLKEKAKINKKSVSRKELEKILQN